jgi:hypothetical protein
MIFFQFFLLDEWTTYFTSFLWTPSTSNSDSVWACGDFFLKTSIKLIFYVFSKELLHATMWLKLPKGLRVGFSKNSSFCPQNLGFSLFFTFFTFFHFFFFFFSWFYMTSPSMRCSRRWKYSGWGALSIAFVHINQKSCFIDGERSLCGMSYRISASCKFFSLFATPWFGTNCKFCF